jgi:hypothetical protein
MKTNKLKKIVVIANTFLIVSFLILSFIPIITYASGLVVCGSDTAEYTASKSVNSTGGTSASLSSFNNVSCQISNLLPEINHLINYLISAVGLFFVFRIVWISTKMVFFAYDQSVHTAAVKDLESAIIGFVIVMIAFILINTIYAVFQIKINGATGFQFSPF